MAKKYRERHRMTHRNKINVKKKIERWIKTEEGREREGKGEPDERERGRKKDKEV